MPVETPSKSYTAAKPLVKRVEDTHTGGDAVKAGGDVYLPRLGGQTDEEYDRYKARGLFMPAVRRTEKGLTGAVMRKDPTAVVPESGEFILADTGSGQPLDMLARKCVEQLQTKGRVGALVDHNGDRPTIALYSREAIINWSSRFIILVESVEAFDPKDPYTVVAEVQLRELTFNEAGAYVQYVWKKDAAGEFTRGSEITPNKQGDPLSEIPFYVMNPVDNTFDDHNPLLLDLADVNLDHYRLATDQRHGLHFTALPTMFIFGSLGVDAEGNEQPIAVGPGTANQILNTEGRAELLEYTGEGLRSIKDAMDDDVATMAAIGARLLQPPRKGVQAAETARIEQSGESATLTTVADSVENALGSALSMAVWWIGGDPDEVEYTLNKDFIDANMPPQQLTALTQAWQAGGLSLDSYLYNLQRGELLPDGRTIEDEKDLIDDAGPDLDG